MSFYDDKRPTTNDEGKYYKLYVTTFGGPEKKPTCVASNLIWFTAKRAAEYAAIELMRDGHRVTKLYRP